MAVELHNDGAPVGRKGVRLPGPWHYTSFFPVIVKAGGLLTLHAGRKGQTRQVSRSVFEKAQFLLSILCFQTTQKCFDMIFNY